MWLTCSGLTSYFDHLRSIFQQQLLILGIAKAANISDAVCLWRRTGGSARTKHGTGTNKNGSPATNTIQIDKYETPTATVLIAGMRAFSFSSTLTSFIENWWFDSKRISGRGGIWTLELRVIKRVLTHRPMVPRLTFKAWKDGNKDVRSNFMLIFQKSPSV